MEKFFAVVGAVGMLLLPVGFLICLCYDLAHPDTRGDWQHDPRLYGTLAIVVIPLIAWIVIREHRK
jgi:hypothetical protein